jgi:hypothetical protein
MSTREAEGWAHRMREYRMNESELVSAIIELAGATNWYRHHQRPAQNRSGQWSSAIQGDKGWVDLALAHKVRPNLLLIEVKSDTGRLSAEQKVWGERLQFVAAMSPGLRYGVWAPPEWRDGTIESVLRNGWEL